MCACVYQFCTRTRFIRHTRTYSHTIQITVLYKLQNVTPLVFCGSSYAAKRQSRATTTPTTKSARLCARRVPIVTVCVCGCMRLSYSHLLVGPIQPVMVMVVCPYPHSPICIPHRHAHHPTSSSHLSERNACDIAAGVAVVRSRAFHTKPER